MLDEADQMADMGFMPQVTRLLDQVRADGQRLLFSATLDRNVDLLVRRYLSDPVVHSVDPSAGAVTAMEHHLLHVQGVDKQAAVTEIAARDGRVIMFLDTKHAVDRLTRDLLAVGVRASALHGGKSQGQRTRTLAGFKSGHANVLVATNVAARGIHVDNLDLVVNVDPPNDHKDYLHRGGRTARAGESGTVVTLVLPGQRRGMNRLMADASITPEQTRVRAGETPTWSASPVRGGLRETPAHGRGHRTAQARPRAADTAGPARRPPGAPLLVQDGRIVPHSPGPGRAAGRLVTETASGDCSRVVDEQSACWDGDAPDHLIRGIRSPRGGLLPVCRGRQDPTAPAAAVGPGARAGCDRRPMRVRARRVTLLV